MSDVISIQRPAAATGGLHTFAVEEDRRRLTAAAIKAVVRLIEAWGGSNAEGAALLGISESTWDRIKSGRWDGALSQDQLTRAFAPSTSGAAAGLPRQFGIRVDEGDRQGLPHRRGTRPRNSCQVTAH